MSSILKQKKLLIEKKNNILKANKHYIASKEEFTVYLKKFIDLEIDILNKSSKTLLRKEEKIDKIIQHLEDKKLFVELTEEFQIMR